MSYANSERWDEIDSLFNAALDQPRERRHAFVDAESNGDRQLRDAVLELLDSSEAADAFWERPGHAPGPLLEGISQALEGSSALEVGQRIAAYRVVREIGRGGSGTVYLAERDDEHFTQRVAIKVLRRGLDTEDVLRRFLSERQILATLAHPNIAQLYDGGALEDGRPYVIMEYVDGQPITEYCDANRLTITQRLAVFLDVCNAVEHAHQNLIVHRDLKPSNILVTDDGTVKLLDFGIAKLLDDSQSAAALTRTGLRLLTPEYASPEQIRGETVTTAADIYQLGALLFRILTGRRPYALDDASVSELERVVLEEEPETASIAAVRAPSTRSESSETATPDCANETPPDVIAEWRRATPRQLRNRLRGDLDTILLEALRKEPEHRYATATQLAADIRRHMKGLPISARPNRWTYRARKFARRRPGTAATITALLIAAAGYLVTVRAHAEELRIERDRVRREATRSAEIIDFLVGLFEAADPNRSHGEEPTPRELVDLGHERIAELDSLPVVQATLQTALGRVSTALGRYDEAARLISDALETRTQLHGEDHDDITSGRLQLAKVRIKQGDAEEAYTLARQALDDRLRRPGSSTSEIADAHRTTGSALAMQGDFDSAETHFRAALEERDVLGRDHTVVRSALNSLGWVLVERGEYDEAEEALLDAIAIGQRTLGERHPEVASTLHNLVMLYWSMGQYEEAEPAAREILEIHRDRYGDDHPETATSMVLVGLIRSELQEFDEAEALYDEALAVRRQVHGDRHIKVAEVLNNLGTLYAQRGEFDAAATTLQESLDIHRHVYSSDHPHVATGLSNLGVVIQRSGDQLTARRYFQEALEIRSQSLGERSTMTARSYMNLGTTYLETGDLGEAERLIGRAIEIFEASLPDDHASFVKARGYMERVRQGEREPQLAGTE